MNILVTNGCPSTPPLFSMPPETRLKIIHVEDAGRAFRTRKAKRDRAPHYAAHAPSFAVHLLKHA